MGCPAKKVCKRAAGSALLADETLVGHILDAVVSAVDVPVTLKIRTGTDHTHRNGVTIARIAESAGVQMLTVHGRTRADRFNGEAEYETIAQIVDAVSIPVVANGDIDSAHKANQVLRQTSAEGIMIGRAAQGQLWLPGAIAAALAAGLTSHTAPSVTRQLDIQRRHLTALHAFYGTHLGHRIARKHFAWFLESLAQQEQLTENQGRWCRRRFNEITTPQAQLNLLDELTDYIALSATQHGHRASNDSKPGAKLAA